MQDNMQLKVNQLLLNKPKVDLSKEDVKGKVVVEIDDSNDQEEQVIRKRPRTRRLKRALQKQRSTTPPRTQMTVNELISAQIEG